MNKSISQPPEWWDQFQAAADAAGVPLSAWIGNVCRDALTKKAQRQLPDRRAAHRPKKGKTK